MRNINRLGRLVRSLDEQPLNQVLTYGACLLQVDGLMDFARLGTSFAALLQS
jgi:hypothetical protein